MSAEDDDDGRVHLGFVTISGDAESGLRVCLPKSTALEHGFEPGDVVPVEFDGEREEFVLKKPAIAAE